MSGIERTVLALRMKPIFEARALAKKQEGVNQYSSLSPNSDEATPDIFTGEVQPVAPVKAPAHRWWISARAPAARDAGAKGPPVGESGYMVATWIASP